MRVRPGCIQSALADPCLMRMADTNHTRLFAHYNTITLNPESVGALHTLKMKAINSEFHIRKKQMDCLPVISFVAWVPSTVAPFCSLPRPCKCMLYFISVQNH